MSASRRRIASFRPRTRFLKSSSPAWLRPAKGRCLVRASPEGLRICATRFARSVYPLRNERNIAHKNPVDPNTFDLALAHQCAAWIMAELLLIPTLYFRATPLPMH